MSAPRGHLLQLGQRYLSKYDRMFHPPDHKLSLEEMIEGLEEDTANLKTMVILVKEGKRDPSDASTSMQLASSIASIMARSLAISVAMRIVPEVVLSQKEAGML